MIADDVKRGRYAVVWALVLASVSVLWFGCGEARAEGNPDITASVSSSSRLYGSPVHVTVSADNPTGEPYGYNLSYRVVLPEGVSYAGGALVAPQQIDDQPVSGQTTLIFRNVSDLSPNSTGQIGFDLDYSETLFDAGDSFAVAAEAFVNSDPRFLPKFDSVGNPVGPQADSFTGYSSPATGTQTLKPIEVDITEPSPEGELLRGVHEHQTVYTATVTNNGVNPTTGTRLDVYVPAGLEFLGCGGPDSDNTTDAPSNPGSAEEYPGSGPIEVESLAGCVEPESVETELVDPDGAGPLPTAVYTHVVWPVGALAAGEVRTFPYRAAVPIRANTNEFSGTRPSAASGEQATNLDNNNGPEPLDEAVLHTHAVVSGTYQGDTPVPATDEETLDRTAEDWVVHKSSSSDILAQGAITTWTLRFETSEYKYIDDATVTDTLPSGLCPLGPVNYTTQNTPDDSECDPVEGVAPSAPYASAVENADGTFSITWNSSSLAQLGHTDVSDDFTITFPTRTRADYQSDFEATTPILTRDRISNSVETEGAGWARCTAPGTPDCSTPGPKIYFTGVDGALISDAGAAGQESGEATIAKQVAQAGTDCQAATYVNTVPTYHPGDRVCWRVRVEFPGVVDTSPQALADYMPASVEYELGSDEPTPADNVESTVDESASADGLLSWTIDSTFVPAGSQVFEHVFSTIATPVDAPATGDLTGNLLKFSSLNTAGESRPQRAEAEYEIETPEVDLTKGVEEIVRGGSTVEGPNGPDVDDLEVEADDEVTYRVDVTNDGAQAAANVEVWDVLPAEYPCTAIGAISAGGECVESAPTDRVVWVVPSLGAEATTKLTYTATVPSDIGPGRTIDNTAGVRHFQGETNLGGFYDYTPAENIDPSLDPETNAPEATDPSSVFTAGATVAKSQTTSVNEAGNNLGSQATIGERIKYTITATVPEGTTLGGVAQLTDAFNNNLRQTIVSGTATATLNGGSLPPDAELDTAGTTPRIVFPAGYANLPGSGDDVFVLGFEAVVTDVGANTRTAGNLTDQATLAWTDDGPASVKSNTTSTTIVEPLISQTKSDDVNPGAVVPGAIVTYTLTTSNSSAARVSTAHELEIVDQVPAGLIPVGLAPGNEPLADDAEVPGSGGAIWDADTRTISKTVATLAPGAKTSFSYRAEVEKPAVAGTVLTNEVESTTASLDEGASERRTSGTGYAAEAEDTIRIAASSIAKSVTPEEATPGEPLSYALTVTIPPSVNLYDTTVYDVLPAGVEFDGYAAESCVSGCPAPNSISHYEAAAGPGGTVKIGWDLGDIAALEEPLVLELTYDAHLLASERESGTEVSAGDTAVNTATTASNLTDKEGPFDPSEIPDEFDESEEASATVTVIEPELTLDKRIKVGSGSFGDGPATAHSDDQLAYRLVVTNEGDAPAYDVELTDATDAALTDVEVVAQAGVTVTSPWTAPGDEMSFAIPGPIPVGGSVTIEYTASFVAASELHDGQQVLNTAAVPAYFGVAEADREVNPSWEFREYEDGTDSTEAVLDFPSLTLIKTTGLAGNPDTGSAEIGQAFPWRIVVANGSATAGAAEVAVEDVLPPNWEYVTGSTTFSSGGSPDPTVTPDAAGDRLAWTIATLAAGESVTISFEAKPLLAAGTDPGTGPEANVNTAAVVSTQDEAGNSGNEEGPYGTGPDPATATLEVPVLDVEKTPDGGAATAGAQASFTVTVNNEGDGVARDVDVVDVLPAGLAYAAGTASADPTTGFSETGVTAGPGAGETTVEWRIASIPAGGEVEITVPVTLDADLADGVTLTNEVTVSSVDTPDPVEDEGSVEVDTEADVAIEKSGDATYTAGTEYSWDLRVRNLGPSDAQAVVVTDPLPAETSFVAADSPCTEAPAGVVSCALGTLPAGFDQTYEVTVAVDADTTTDPLANTASVATSTDDPEPDNDESTFGPEPSPLADVWIEKSADPEAILKGHETTFTIVVHNDGPSVARAVGIEDPLPAGLSFVSVDDSDCEGAAGVVSCALGDLAPGGERTIRVTVNGAANGIHTNVATVSTTTPEPPDHKSNTAEAEVEVGPVADLAIEKTGPATVAAEGSLTWNLKVTNNGADPATGVEIVDQLPAGTEFAGADAGCEEAGGTVTCAIGVLAVAESAERSISVTVPRALADSTVLNTARVHGDQGDDEPANDEDEASTQVGPSIDVSVVKTGPGRVNANGTIAWTLAVANAGPSTATAVRVVDTLPAGVELVSATPTQGSCAGVTCELGSLPAGGTAQIQVVVHVPASMQGATLVNAADVSATEPDPVPDNDHSEAVAVVDPPAPSDYDLSIEKRIGGSQQPVVGATMRYELVVVNSGPAGAEQVEVVDALPHGVEYVSAGAEGGKCTVKQAILTCRLGSLAAGERRRVTVKVRVVEAGKIVNTATVSAAVADADPRNDTSTVTAHAVLGKAKLKLEKVRVGGGRAGAGDRVRFKIRVRNVGSAAAADVVVCDRLPKAMSFVKVPGARLKRGDACWTIDLLQPNRSKTFHVVARVSGDVAGNRLRNLAYANADNAAKRRSAAAVRVTPSGPGRAGGVTG